MPKINVRLGVLSYSVYDQNKRLEQGVVTVKRESKSITLAVPLKLLGYPQEILTSARTYLGNLPLQKRFYFHLRFKVFQPQGQSAIA